MTSPVSGRRGSEGQTLPFAIGVEEGMNLYAYVGNDPLNLIDPYGLSAWETAKKAYRVYNSLASGLISQPAQLSSSLSSSRGPGMSVAQAFNQSNPRHEFVTENEIRAEH